VEESCLERCFKGVKGGGHWRQTLRGGGWICLSVTGVHLTVGYTGVHAQTFGVKMDHAQTFGGKWITKEGRQKVVDVFTKESRGEQFDTESKHGIVITRGTRASCHKMTATLEVVQCQWQVSLAWT
jgi:hypothetical protein